MGEGTTVAARAGLGRGESLGAGVAVDVALSMIVGMRIEGNPLGKGVEARILRSDGQLRYMTPGWEVLSLLNGGRPSISGDDQRSRINVRVGKLSIETGQDRIPKARFLSALRVEG